MRKISFVMLIEAIALIVVVLFNLALMGSIGNSIMMLLDIPSIILMILFVVPGMAASGMWKDFFKAFSVGKKTFSILQLKKIEESIKLLEKLIICGAIFTVMIAVIMIIARLDNPQTIGPNLAVAILSILYATIVEFFLVPLHSCVKVHILEEMEFENEEE